MFEIRSKNSARSWLVAGPEVAVTGAIDAGFVASVVADADVGVGFLVALYEVPRPIAEDAVDSTWSGARRGKVVISDCGDVELVPIAGVLGWRSIF